MVSVNNILHKVDIAIKAIHGCAWGAWMFNPVFGQCKFAVPAVWVAKL